MEEDRGIARGSGEEPEGAEPPTVEAAPGVAAIEGPGSVIGPYKLLQVIGEGGFGVVYMAQQTAPVRRRVAIKVLKPGMDSKQVIGRFETERQALAMMEHANIARVLDAGTTSAGRPYFVMELVKGVPITQYCDDASLTTEERLKLFATVCDAVQHAHNKGIIHRDLKPGNILIALHDERPVAKVIDFGIAKAMNQDLTENTVFTAFKNFIGTPEYMSPEQAAMSGLDVDTRSDVYSLGVVLYELVTGTAPFDTVKLRSAAFDEVQRIIREEDPPRPSTRVGEVTQQGTGEGKGSGEGKKTSAERIAKHRRTDPKSLRRALAGDLDWIVMKCLEKDRQRRYETASGLGHDIERFLAHEPVTAHPPTAAYRLRKFARRNRGLIGIGAGSLCALLLTIVALTYGLIEAQHERDRTAMRETIARAQMVIQGMNAVRSYTTQRVRPSLLGDEASEARPKYTNFRPEMIPAFAARGVFDRVKSQAEHEGFVYKEASPNPTNPANKADEFELSLVKLFKDDPTRKETTGERELNGRLHYYTALPMRVLDASCLDCHTTPEMAPPKQIELYGRTGGYGWQMGDVVAAQIVYAPMSQAVKSDGRGMTAVLGSLAGVFVLGGVASAWWLRRA